MVSVKYWNKKSLDVKPRLRSSVSYTPKNKTHKVETNIHYFFYLKIDL